MGRRPHILVIDPAPAREGLAERLATLGASCTVARGLHDAMVQCIIRNPVLIVADLSIPGSAGAECRRRLAELPHFRQAPFLSIGPGEDLPETADSAAVAERVRALLPELVAAPQAPAEAPAPPPEPPRGSPPRAPAAPLSAELDRLRAETADTTLTVRAPDGRLGEIMLRRGVPIHAVTADGIAGDEALAAMSGWEGARVEEGPPPRPETPETLTPPTPPERSPAETPPSPDRRAQALLEELEALGVVRKVGP